MNKGQIIEKLEQTQKEIAFSGTFFVKTSSGNLTGSYGYSNKAEKIKNELNTRYGIASGSKFITSIAVCQLVDQGKLSFDTKLKDCLSIHFPYFDEGITIHHLLTHTSGIADYFDEDEMDDFEELWVKYPSYHIRTLNDFLPLFQNEKMKYTAGSKFHYNNAGYIVLGLVVEEVSGMSFSAYVEKNIFQKAAINNSGYFEMDNLPEKTALGYIEKPNGGYRTNIFSLPAKGGSDGGVFVTAPDMIALWDALNNDQLLSKEVRELMQKPHVLVEDDIFYSYAGYMQVSDDTVIKHILMGYDPGVNFRSVYYPKENITIVVCSNESDGAYDIIHEIEKLLLNH